MVLLPDPVAPTIASFSPGSMWNDTSFSTFGPPAYANVRCRTSTAPASRDGSTRRRRGFVNALAPVQRLEDPFGARHRAKQHVVLFTDRDDRPEQHVDELREQHHAAERDRLLQHVAAAEPDDHARGGRAEAVDERAVEHFDLHRLVFFAAIFLVDLRVHREVAIFAAIQLHDLDARQILVQILVQR